MGGPAKIVLVVDDDESLRNVCRINLELDGYQVLEAASLADAGRMLAEEHVDAMLLDLHLGDGDGRDLLRSLGHRRPPVALFTGSEAIGPELRALAEDVLAKPFALEALTDTVGRLVSGGPRGIAR
jgi:two-component system, OmpR family, KDP operon response regulator KdpE